MNVDYAALISPYPLSMTGIGHIKSPRLKEIWNPKVTYQGYNLYLSLLLMTPSVYSEQLNQSKSGMAPTPDDEERNNLNMFDIISNDSGLQTAYTEIFNFFFTENVMWDNERRLFLTFSISESTGEVNPVGVINRAVFTQVCDVILQRCGIRKNDTDTDLSTVKSKKALKILKKLQKGRMASSKNGSSDKDMELPNLITSISVKSNSVNFVNVWELTVFQLYEQFKREQTNTYFDIQKISVAAYGNEKKSFKGNEWYKNDN